MPIMRLRNVFSLLCPVLSSACLVIGFWPSGVGMAAGAGLMILLIWLAVRRWPSAWRASLAMAVSTAVAVTGVTTSGGTAWMMISAALGLATWDLLLRDVSPGDQAASIQFERMEKIHDRSLGLALGSGLLVALVGRMIQFQLPFLLMLGLVVLVYLSLDRFLRTLTHLS